MPYKADMSLKTKCIISMINDMNVMSVKYYVNTKNRKEKVFLRVLALQL